MAFVINAILFWINLTALKMGIQLRNKFRNLGARYEVSVTGTVYLRFPHASYIGKVRISNHSPSISGNLKYRDYRCRYGLRVDIKGEHCLDLVIQNAHHREYGMGSIGKLIHEIESKVKRHST
jgi:hypothetical protein